MAYNITNITAGNDLYEIIEATNELSGGLLVIMFMLVLFLVFLIIFKKRDFKKVLLADSFFMIVLGVLAWGMGWIGWTYIIVPIIVFGASLIAFQFMD